jgi:tetratricopeptide (TPR) repeat protein
VATLPADAPPPRAFVGRGTELATLAAAVADAGAGRGRCVLVSGDAGIGKTRLVEEAMAALERPERVLWGRCHEPEGAPAYWPWIQVLRTWMRRQDREALRAQMGDGAGDLARLVPALRDRLGGVVEPPRLEPEPARFRLFDAVATFLRRAAADGLVAIVLDDLQWADSETLLLLGFVAEEIGRARVLLIGTYREVELQQATAVPRILADLARVGMRIPLGGLVTADVGRIVETVGTLAPSPRLVETIHRATEGNPFFVTEIAELLRVEHGPGTAARTANRLRLPDTLRETIRRRLDPLPAESQRILTAAAVLGRDFDLSALAAATGATPEDTLVCLEPALAIGLVARVAGQPGRYRFGHALLQHALIDDLPIAERARLHRQAGEAIESAYASDLAPWLGDLAHHFLQAGDSAALTKAATYATGAGDRAMNALGFEEAAGHFERALHAERRAGGTPRTRLDLLLRFGEAQSSAGDEDGARATLLEAARLARDLRDPRAFATAATRYADARAETGLADETAIGLLEEALAALPPDSPARPYVLGPLAAALYFSPDTERREALSREAVEAARQIGDLRALAIALTTRHFVLWRPGTATERLALATEAMRVAAEAGAVDIVSEARAWRILDLFELEAIDEADRELAQHAADAERLVVPRYRWHATLARGARAFLAGDLQAAEALALGAFGVRQSHGGNNAEQFFGVQMFYLRRAQGRIAEVADTIMDFAARQTFLPIWRCGAALVEADLGRSARARRILDDLAPNGFAILPHDGNLLPSLAALAEVCDLIGEPTHAATIHDRLAPYASTSIVAGTSAAVVGPVARYLGLAALAAGRVADAVAYLEDATARSRRLGAPAEEAWAAFGLARALAARGAAGDAARAASLRADAAAIATRVGLGGLLARLGPGRPAVAPVAGARRASLRREGDYWTIRCGNEVARLKDTKGLAYLDVLLRHPGDEFHSLDLAGGAAGERIQGGDSGEALDEDARRAYRRRLRELEAALAGDDATDALRAEAAAIERELARGTGIGGRVRGGCFGAEGARRAGSDAERARLNVTRAVAAVVKKIAADCPALGRHLRTAVRTGVFCRYEPEPAFPVSWEP